jgi:hypothetical protein
MLPKPTAEPVAAKINAKRDDQRLCVLCVTVVISVSLVIFINVSEFYHSIVN